MSSGTPILGIDLGTTYSCVAFWRGGKTEVIPVSNDRVLASCVGFPADDVDMDIFVGDEARTEGAVSREHLIFDAKRMLGRSFKDLQALRSRWPFQLRENDMHMVEIAVPSMQGDGQTVWKSPEEISSILLVRLVDAAELKFGTRPKEAVIAVPAYFDTLQRDATTKAATMADLEVVRLVNEPTAAAIAYGLEDPKPEKRTVLVFDLGGGTFDISLLAVQGRQVRTLATTGNDRLGGNDFDQRLLSWVLEEWEKEFPGIPCHPASDISRLNKTLEELKCGVNQVGSAKKLLKLEAPKSGLQLRRMLTTEKFNELNEDLFQRCFRGGADGKGGLDELFGSAGKYSRADVDEVLLVGGSTKLLRIRTLLAEYFGGEKLNLTCNASEAVACGAATLAGILALDSTAYQDPNDPPVFVDVLSHSIGVRVRGGGYEVLIPKGQPLPHSIDFRGRTAVPGQRETDICVLEGEKPRADDNCLLGTVVMNNIELPDSGLARLKLELEVDGSGLVKFVARNISQGVQGKHAAAEFKVRPGRLSQRQVDKIRCTGQVQRQEVKDKANISRLSLA